MLRLPNPCKYKNKRENFRFAQTFKDGANSRRSSSMSNFYFSFNFVSFFSYSRKMIFNGFRKKTTTSFYVDVMKTKLTTFICCFTEFNEHKKWGNRVVDNVEYFTCPSTQQHEMSMKGRKNEKKKGQTG